MHLIRLMSLLGYAAGIAMLLYGNWYYCSTPVLFDYPTASIPVRYDVVTVWAPPPSDFQLHEFQPARRPTSPVEPEDEGYVRPAWSMLALTILTFLYIVGVVQSGTYIIRLF